MRKKISEPPVYQSGSNEPTLDPPPKWSVTAFKERGKCAYLSIRNSTPPQLACVQWSLFCLWQLENEEMEAFC
jgi:hypothetical protein